MLGACAALENAAGAGPAASTAWAPGRCTLVGEHVDYAGGQVLCVAMHLGIAAAVRVSGSERFLVTSGDTVVTRTGAGPKGDMGDRVLAPVVALCAHGVSVPPVEVGVAATLPPGAGLASSAALGIPCGPLDQRAVVDAPAHGALLLDCATGAGAPVAWPWPDTILVACDTGTQHDVGGAEYRRRREDTESGLAALSVASCQELTEAGIEAGHLDPVVERRLRHVMGESRRAIEAAQAMRRADVAALGRLMSASHRSLRDLHEVSTPTLDAVVGAAEAVPGCLGARMVGAGFGGTVAALVTMGSAEACRSAMAEACGGGETFLLEPSPGVAVLSPDVVQG